MFSSPLLTISCVHLWFCGFIYKCVVSFLLMLFHLYFFFFKLRNVDTVYELLILYCLCQFVFLFEYISLGFNYLCMGIWLENGDVVPWLAANTWVARQVQLLFITPQYSEFFRKKLCRKICTAQNMTLLHLFYICHWISDIHASFFSQIHRKRFCLKTDILFNWL